MLKYAKELFLCSPLILVFLISVFTPLPVPWSAHPFLIPSNELVVGCPPPLPPAHNLMVPRWSQQGSQHNIFSSTRGGWPDNQYWPNYCIRGFLPHKPSLSSLSLSLSALLYHGNYINPYRGVWGLGYVKPRNSVIILLGK